VKVAVTGNVASGKSTLCRVWAREGVPLVLADELARAVVEPASEGLAAVVAAFGTDILAEDGSLQRGALRDLVFRETERRIQLEGILHPLIQARRDMWMADREAEGISLAVAEIPLLFEVGLEKEFDVVVLVEAPNEERLRRLMENRGLDEEEAKRLMDSQMPSQLKRARADFVVHNAGSEEDLEIRALALLDLLRARFAQGSAP